MLEPILQNVLANKKIVLASSSPRRKEILQNLRLKFDIIPSKFDEDSLDPSKYPTQKDYVLDIAKHKVEAVFEDLKSKNSLPDVIIGADSVVELNNRLFGKPKDPEEAVEFLTLLNGKPHTVHTAVVIKTPTLSKNFVESTTVHMAPLDVDVIKAYVQTKDPLDKAGAYGIQGLGGSLVEKIDGDFYNVMGFPLHRFCVNFKKLFEELERK